MDFETLKQYDLRVRVLPRTLTFKQPAGTSRGVYTERRVWYILITGSGRDRLRGIGECAPLYDLSCDYTPQYEEKLRSVCADFERTRRVDYERLRQYPSILFGLETACLSAQASLKRGDFLALYDTPFTRSQSGIIINGLVWMGNYNEMFRRMDAKLSAGFRCVKLKIGAIDFEAELDLIRRLRSRYTPADVELRVDANGAFAVNDAMDRLERLARYDIHSIEQPIRAGQWPEMARLCRLTPLPIALDEELIGVNTPELKQQMLDEIRPQYIILKPTLHGGLTGAEEWMKLAAERDIPYWVTSALESNIGLNAIAQWTSAVSEKIWKENGGQYRVCLPNVHGLGTGQLFVRNYEGTCLHIVGDRLWRGDEDSRRFAKDVEAFRKDWFSDSREMKVKTSGSTGVPKEMLVSKDAMTASAEATCRFLKLKKGDSALLCMPLQFIAGKMLAVRCFVTGMHLVAVKPSSHPFASLTFAPTFVAMTPQQVFETLRVPRERHLLRMVRCLIIGGGAISESLQATLKSFPNDVWSTYGMTETLSHIALRKINGPQPQSGYTPLPHVNVRLTADSRLIIDAPSIGVSGLVTNDIAEINSDGTFRILGRKDNVVCSGGIKLQTEDIERRLSAVVADFCLTSVPDEALGEALTMLYVGDASRKDELKTLCRTMLSRYEVPRHFVPVAAIPHTETGKIARADARRFATQILGKKH